MVIKKHYDYVLQRVKHGHKCSYIGAAHMIKAVQMLLKAVKAVQMLLNE